MTTPSQPGIRVVLLRLAAFYWASQIFWLSSDSFHSSNSRVIIAKLARMLGLDLSSETLWVLNTIARKSAHVVEYAVFSILLYFSFRGLDWPSWDQRAARMSLMAACAYAMLDEFRQGFSLYRGSSPFDFALDCFGATLGIAMIYAGCRAYREAALARHSG
mgnify:CR=1 FL=1